MKVVPEIDADLYVRICHQNASHYHDVLANAFSGKAETFEHLGTRATIQNYICDTPGACDSVLVKALCYKPEGRGFDARWGECFISVYLSLLHVLGPGIYSDPNRNE
jgi:hypothetical protein